MAAGVKPQMRSRTRARMSFWILPSIRARLLACSEAKNTTQREIVEDALKAHLDLLEKVPT